MLAELTDKVSGLVDGRDAVGFNVKFDLGDTGTISIAGESAPMAVSNDSSDAEVTFIMSAEDLNGLFSGELSAMNAYMMGKLVVEGDLGKAMQLSSLFG